MDGLNWSPERAYAGAVKKAILLRRRLPGKRVQMASVMAEHEWLVDHHAEAEKHSGRWIAILEGKIIADGKSFEQAYKKAEAKRPGTTPLVIYIPTRSEELLIL
jgi:hypothetical protein